MTLLTVVGTVILLALALRPVRSGTIYQERIENIRSRGEPLTPGEMAARFTAFPAGDDVRHRLQMRFPGWNPEGEDSPLPEAQGSVGSRTSLIPGSHGSAAARAALEREVRAGGAATDLLLGDDFSGLIWNAEYVRETDLLKWVKTTGYVPRLALCRALAKRAVWEAESGNPDRAASAVERGLQLARIAGPTGVMGASVQIGLEGIMLDALEAALDRCRWSDLALRRIASMLEGNPHRLLEDAVLAERVLYVSCMDLDPTVLMKNLGASRWEQGLISLLKVGRGHSARLRALDYFEGLLKASRLPPRTGVEAARRTRADLEAWRGHRLRQLILPLDLDSRIDLMVLSKPDVLFPKNFDRHCALEVSKAVIAMERWRRANGDRLPSSWKVLVPEYLSAVPLDPADDQPLRYVRPEGGGYRVYSCGSDLSDDGGVERRRIGGPQSGFDVILLVSR